MTRTTNGRVKAIEQIALALQTAGLRKAAFAPVRDDEELMALVREVAEVTGLSGLRTLVLDVSGSNVGPAWVPHAAEVVPVADPQGLHFDVLSSPASSQARATYNNPARVAAALDGLLERYDLVLIAAAGVTDDDDDRINAVAACAAADGIVMVCPMAEVPVALVERAMQLVTAAGGKVVGTVTDDRSNPTIGDDMARATRRLLSFAPGLADRIAGWLSRRELLRAPVFR
jgi:hypothetical protein